MTEIEDALNRALRDLKSDGATAVTLHLRKPAFDSFIRRFPPLSWFQTDIGWGDSTVILTEGPQVVVCTLQGKQHVRSLATVRFCTPCGNYWHAEHGPLVEECPGCTSTQLGWATLEWAMFSEVEARAKALENIARGALSWKS